MSAPPTAEKESISTTPPTQHTHPAPLDEDQPPAKTEKSLGFWLIIASLLVSTFVAALDLTAISTALPTIAASLNARDYTWIANAYSVTSVAVVPWSGGLAHVFGRRPVLLAGILFFTVGSALCGAAPDIGVMYAGRALQGVGAGVILTLTEIVLADLVSLADRGAYQGAVGAVWALASAVGPVIGGAFAIANWRWLFYLNLFLCGFVAVALFFFLHLKAPPGTLREKLSRMDIIGNLVFMPAVTLFIVGLVWGGQTYPWNDARVLATLIVGGIGLVVWVIVERYWCEYPTVPFKLMNNRTTNIGFFTTLVHGVLALPLFYYWPVYFQSVKGASPIRSAVDFFSVAFVTAPFAMIAGASIGALQIYKPQNVIAWVLLTLGPGLMGLIKYNSPTSLWAPIVIPYAAGVGLLYAATTFPVLAPLPPSLAGRSLAFLVFVRNLGNVFGVTLGSTVLANELAKKTPQAFKNMLPPGGGIAGAFSLIPQIKHFDQPLRTQVEKAFSDSLRMIWLVLIAFGAVGLIASFFIQSISLNTVTDEAWGLQDKQKPVDAEQANAESSTT